MKKLNKITVLFAILLFFTFSVYAENYITLYEENVHIEDAVISEIDEQPYTGKAITPVLTITYNGVTLIEGTDYTLTYSNNIKIGTAKIIIEGKGNYIGTKTVTFKILRNIASAKVSGLVTKTYTGSRQGQKLTVKHGTATLKAGTHYTVSYVNNINAGTATITITGKGIYAGTKTVTFKISRRSITGLSFSKVKNYYYRGKAISPNVTVKYGTRALVKNTDYTIAYTRNINAGTATITITGKGNFSGTKKITFKINKKAISSATVTGLVGKTYTGSKQYQSLTLKYNGITLKNGTHYTLSYTKNINVGTATVRITGIGNFSGSKKLSFKIYKRNVNTLDITTGRAMYYAGSARTPAVTVKQGSKILTKNTHYTVAYKNNLNIGTATMTVTGKGNYTGTKTFTFEIKPRAISTVTITGLANKVYTGNRIGQSLKLTYGKVTLKAGTDYTLAYDNNTEVGTAIVTITGKGNFSGSKKLSFKINKRNVSSLTYSKISSCLYTGKAIMPAITVKYGTKTLVEGTDYVIAYTNNVKVGTAAITVTGKGNFTGSKKINFDIVRKKYYIKVNYQANVVTIYDKGTTGKYDKPIKAMICSTGTATPRLGKYGIKSRWTWLKMYGGVYGHYVTQITGDILFHSVPYLKKSIDTLEYWEYDKLGTSASMGCVRLTAIDAKWIYDNVAHGSTVEFYASTNPGPLGKPTAMKISEYEEYRNWDPTDPSVRNPWKEFL